MSDNIKQFSKHIVGVPKGEKEKQKKMGKLTKFYKFDETYKATHSRSSTNSYKGIIKKIIPSDIIIKFLETNE